MNKLYLILKVTEVNPMWWGVLICKEHTARTSLDGSLVVLKLPEGVKTKADVPEEYIADFIKYKPQMLTYEECLKVVHTKEWEIDV